MAQLHGLTDTHEKRLTTIKEIDNVLSAVMIGAIVTIAIGLLNYYCHNLYGFMNSSNAIITIQVGSGIVAAVTLISLLVAYLRKYNKAARSDELHEMLAGRETAMSVVEYEVAHNSGLSEADKKRIAETLKSDRPGTRRGKPPAGRLTTRLLHGSLSINTASLEMDDEQFKIFQATRVINPMDNETFERYVAGIPAEERRKQYRSLRTPKPEAGSSQTSTTVTPAPTPVNNLSQNSTTTTTSGAATETPAAEQGDVPPPPPESNE